MGKDLREEKGEDLRGEKALGGKGGKGSQPGRGGKDLGEEKREDLAGGGGGKREDHTLCVVQAGSSFE